jgi:hypothetical protein
MRFPESVLLFSPERPYIPAYRESRRALKEGSVRRQRETARSGRSGGNQRAQDAVRPRTLDRALDRAAFQTRARVQGRSGRWFAATFRPCTPGSAVEGSACSTRSSARVQLGMCTDEDGIAYGLAHVCAGAAWLRRVQTRGKFQKSSLARTTRHLHACKGQSIGGGRRSQRRGQLAKMYAQ